MSGSGSGFGNNSALSSGIRGTVAIPTDDDNLALAAIITVALQLAVYLIACTFKFDYITDFAGGTNFLLLAVISFGLSAVSLQNIMTDYNILPPQISLIFSPPVFLSSIMLGRSSSLFWLSCTA